MNEFHISFSVQEKWNGRGHSSRNVSSGWLSFATTTNTIAIQLLTTRISHSPKWKRRREFLKKKKKKKKICFFFFIYFHPFKERDVDEKISRPNMSPVYPIRMNVYSCTRRHRCSIWKSEVAEKCCCWSKQLERNSFVTHQQLGTHTEGGRRWERKK